jgi:Asp-tRNA(Asn)/Glu-tRNA(Gln) amidotransferase A subunit family amidase
MTEASLLSLDATAALRALREGDVTAERYAQALLGEAQRLAHLNAFRTLDPARVLEAARNADQKRASGAPLGALHGLPIPVKDSVNTRDLPTSQGTRSLAKFQPRADASVLTPLYAAGAILMGKTNLHEISRGWTSNNGAFGAVLNPHDPTRSPGGSSGGSAVAVAARMAPLAVAEDTLGSIRVPASMCGVAGLRPTFGRYPGDGIMSLTDAKFDQVGPLARSVADLALFDAVITGEHAPLATKLLANARIAFSAEDVLTHADPEVERVVLDVIARLRAAGATIITEPWPRALNDALAIATTLIAYENIPSIAGFLRKYATGVSFDELIASSSPNVQYLYKTSTPPSRIDYDTALAMRATLKKSLAGFFAAHALDALIFPPILSAALPLGDPIDVTIRGKAVSIRLVMGRNTAFGSCGSLASLILPAGMTTAKLPVGIELAGLPGSDRAILALGAAIERVLDPQPPPPLAHLSSS